MSIWRKTFFVVPQGHPTRDVHRSSIYSPHWTLERNPNQLPTPPQDTQANTQTSHRISPRRCRRCCRLPRSRPPHCNPRPVDDRLLLNIRKENELAHILPSPPSSASSCHGPSSLKSFKPQGCIDHSRPRYRHTHALRAAPGLMGDYIPHSL